MPLSLSCHGYWLSLLLLEPLQGTPLWVVREAHRRYFEVGWTVLWASLWGWRHFEWPCFKEDNPAVNPLHTRVPPAVHVCPSITLPCSHLLPLCRSDIMKWSPGAGESAAVRAMGRPIAGRLTEGQDVRRLRRNTCGRQEQI